MGSTLGHRSPVFLHTVPLGKQTHAQKHSLNASNYSQTILRGRKQQFRQTDISKVLLSVSLCLLSNFKRASLCVHAALLVTSPQVLHALALAHRRQMAHSQPGLQCGLINDPTPATTPDGIPVLFQHS